MLDNTYGRREFGLTIDESFGEWVGKLPIENISDYSSQFEEKKDILIPLAQQNNEKSLMKWIYTFGIDNVLYQESIAAAMIQKYKPETSDTTPKGMNNKQCKTQAINFLFFHFTFRFFVVFICM